VGGENKNAPLIGRAFFIERLYLNSFLLQVL
jgi:hypothetical protein